MLPIIGWSQSYVGTVGNYPIHLEVTVYPNANDTTSGELEGFYFYDSKLISIPVSGSYNKESITLIDDYYFTPEKVFDANEVFELKKKKNQLIGTLKIKEESFKVVLTETSQEPLEDFRNPKLNFVKDSVVKYKGKQLIWFTEHYSKLPLFRLGNGFTKAQRDTFNPILDAIHLSDAKDKLDCNTWFEMSYDINLVNTSFISYLKHYSVYCGGAHPSYGNVGYTFNLETLEVVVDIESLFPEVDFFQKLKEKYQNTENDVADEECETFVNDSYWQYKTWNLTSEGVLLIPNYPHAMTPCEDLYFLSYAELTKA
ncbi:hypothetical protein HNV08_03485 [Winogradskyella eckloniae]|uniref:hypothetical protein n=1 Tax=Winogradskyella eckloniae TaxID=1089306 RepID=UPI00156526B7|nr:hypothetical protein [Winogradskyella eckloniae]NRD19098.1 hypothetical protein [Winogradskyella eckloniae]